MLGEIYALPTTKDCYGTIHYDKHMGKFCVDDVKSSFLIFCDCQFKRYAADIASAIFFMVQKVAGFITNKSEEKRTEFTKVL